MKKIFIYLLFGIILTALVVKLSLQPGANSSDAINEYFPINVGNFWEYEGVKEEQVAGGTTERSTVKNRIEIVDVTENDNGVVIKLASGSTYMAKGTTIDFETDSTETDRFALTFPLSVGQKWGDQVYLTNRTDGFYVWEVEAKAPQEILGKHYDECYRIALKVLSGTDYKIFCYGLGVVEEGYTHNGTILKETYKLTRFKIN